MSPARRIGAGLLTALALVAAGYFAWRAERGRQRSERIFLGSLPLPSRQLPGASFELRGYEEREDRPSRLDSLERAFFWLKERDFSSAMANGREAISLSTATGLPWHSTESRALLGVARDISHHLPARHEVLQVCRLPVAGLPELWVVLAARANEYRSRWLHPRLLLFRCRNGGYQRLWRSELLSDPSSASGEYRDLHLHVADFTGDGIPEVTVLKFAAAASSYPTDLDLFAWQEGRLSKNLALSGGEVPWIEDLNHDGRYEIGIYSTIGTSMSHADQPRWNDVYAYKNGRWALANNDFPTAFRDLEREITTLLRAHPEDDDLRRHLKLIRDVRRPRSAPGETARDRPAVGQRIRGRGGSRAERE